MIRVAAIKIFIIFLSLSCILPSCNRISSSNSSNKSISKRLILIGIDGFSTDGLQIARTPNLDSLIRSGCLSLKTRGVMPTVSAPNWGSMLLGAGPEQHGILNNGWTVENKIIMPQVEDEDGYFPSVFNLIKDVKPELKTGMFYQWSGLADLYNPRYIDSSIQDGEHYESMEKAYDFIKNEKGDFTFFYINWPDHEGHEKGHYTEAYYKSIETVDSTLGIFFKRLKDDQMYNDSHFMVISDHGGQGFGHGGNSMAEMEVPWIISGPGINKNKLLTGPNNNFNTAATILYLFGIDIPDYWIGKTVKEAFQDLSNTKSPEQYVSKPYVDIKNGIYTDPQSVSIMATDEESTIYYTTDGSVPNENSIPYTGAIRVNNSGKLKIIAMKNGNSSKIVSREINIVTEIKSLTLKYPPSEKYSADGPYSLVDKSIGGKSYTSSGWLGFEKQDLISDILLPEQKNIKNIKVSILDAESSWIFKPLEVNVQYSGKKYSYKLDELTVDSQKNGRKVITIPINSTIDSFTLSIINQGVCPEEHPGKGNPAWLFVDEIMIE